MSKIGIGGFGSVNNHLDAIGTRGAPEPEVGMGCTKLGWTDRFPYTVIEVVKRKGRPRAGEGPEVIDYIRVQEDTSRRVDDNGMSECQSYEFVHDPDGKVCFAKRNKRNQWVLVRTPRDRAKVKDVIVFRMGERDRYHDYSF